jgi:outer membrane immunogenic protein
VKGGGAWAKYKYSNSDPLSGGTFNASETRSGWTIGGGVEYAFAGNWSAKVEYDYIDFGTKTVTFPDIPTATGFPEGLKNTINEVKVGVNYRFGGPY